MDDLIKLQIEKYSKGWTPNKLGKTIIANKHIDFKKFAEYMENRVSRNTLKIQLHYLHKFNFPINEENIINFEENIEEINDQRHDYNTPKITTKNGKQQFKNWVSKYDNLSAVMKKDNHNRLKYNVFLSLKNYLKAQKMDNLSKLLPSTKSINKPHHNIKMGYLSEEEMWLLINTVDDEQFKIFIMFLFYTGCRIGEALNFKKNNSWIDIYKKDKDFFYSSIDKEKKKLFKINLPREFIKRDTYPYVYIDNIDAIKMVYSYLNKIKHDDYVFKFIEIKGIKTYFNLKNERDIVDKKIKEYMIKAGLEIKKDEITPHGLRRSNIHYTYKKTGKHVTLTQQRARHSTFDMTAKYLKPKQEELEDALQKDMDNTGN
ncbi:site-specific integrase [bacterium]|nr:site-specific integrase [bacterium]